jgi:quercetin dioxygenase-like cupin family protein
LTGQALVALTGAIGGNVLSTPHAVSLAALARFDPDRMTKIDVAGGSRLFLGLNCFEPGQAQRTHAHHGADKFYLVISGKASIEVDGALIEATTGDMVWAPSDVPHGVAPVAERTVLLIGLAPPPGS